MLTRLKVLSGFKYPGGVFIIHRKGSNFFTALFIFWFKLKLNSAATEYLSNAKDKM